MVVDLGYDPSRSSPSDQSPGFISARRTPVLSTKLERVERIELSNSPWQGLRLPLHHTRIVTGGEYRNRTYPPVTQ